MRLKGRISVNSSTAVTPYGYLKQPTRGRVPRQYDLKFMLIPGSGSVTPTYPPSHVLSPFGCTVILDKLNHMQIDTMEAD